MSSRLSRFLVVAMLLLNGCESPAADSGVILMYHHVDDAAPESTSVSPAAFLEQMAFLEREDFNVVPLIHLLGTLNAEAELPPKSVAITFDDAYSSVLTEALPLLESRGWPFTVFVNTEAIDEGFGGYLNWDQLRQLGESGASIGNHSVTHSHLVRRLANESASAWRRRVSEEITLAADRLQAEVGEYLIPVFAYPYGEYTAEIKSIVQAQGLYGVGQQSGAIGRRSDFLALPRYPIATGLEMDDFALRVRSMPLPVTRVSDQIHIVPDGEDRPSIRLRLDSIDGFRVAELACYASGQGVTQLEWLNNEMREFRVRPQQPLRAGRSKINCTAPSSVTSGVYYWYGHLWMRRLPNGRWYDE